MVRDHYLFSEKTYRERRPYRRAPKPAPPAPSFTERKAGDDIVQDIIDAAAALRAAHPSYKRAAPLMSQDGGVRMFWAIMLDAISKASGISFDDLIERVRDQARLAGAERTEDKDGK